MEFGDVQRHVDPGGCLLSRDRLALASDKGVQGPAHRLGQRGNLLEAGIEISHTGI